MAKRVSLAQRWDLPPYYLEVSTAVLIILFVLMGWQLGPSMPAVGDGVDSGDSALLAYAISLDAAQRSTRRITSLAREAAQPVRAALVLQDERLAADLTLEDVTCQQASPGIERLMAAVCALEAEGRTIAVYLRNEDSGATLLYRVDDDHYPASSIKAPYVGYLYEQVVDAASQGASEVDGLAEPTIVWSDNEAYAALHQRFGQDGFAKWALACGAIDQDSEAYQRFAGSYYPHCTTRQLAALWEHLRGYLDAGSAGALHFAELLSRREESPLRDGVGEGCETLCKAGWYPGQDGYGSMAATVDAGIVREEGTTYLVVLMTDLPADLEGLTALVPDIWAARDALG